jgi:TRAP-type uncharacterized transport system fused permease subunit
MWLCIPFYIVPLWFLYSDLITGTWSIRLIDTAILSIGFFLLAAASSKYLFKNLNKFELILIWPAALALLIPNKTINIYGFTLTAVIMLYFFIQSKRINNAKI